MVRDGGRNVDIKESKPGQVFVDQNQIREKDLDELKYTGRV